MPETSNPNYLIKRSAIGGFKNANAIFDFIGYISKISDGNEGKIDPTIMSELKSQAVILYNVAENMSEMADEEAQYLKKSIGM